MTTRHYKVGGHRLHVSAAEKHFALMGNYEPFAVAPAEEEPLVSLTVSDNASDSLPSDFVEELCQDDEGQQIRCGHTAGSPAFGFSWQGQTAGWLVCSADYREATLRLTSHVPKLAIDNALMVLYALAAARRDTLLFHAAVVAYGGRAYLFLGPSGTGKSTHASLWLRHIKGAHLVNDDNPVVTLVPADGGTMTAFVHGSPWSGKTPCYRNEAWPVGAIVTLSQAPFNRMQRLSGLQAYAALMGSISGKRWDRGVADGLHHSENALVQCVPLWHLQCLPDAAAAQLCQTTVCRP